MRFDLDADTVQPASVGCIGEEFLARLLTLFWQHRPPAEFLEQLKPDEMAEVEFETASECLVEFGRPGPVASIALCAHCSSHLCETDTEVAHDTEVPHYCHNAVSAR